MNHLTARLSCLFSLLILCAVVVHADGPQDNIPDKVRPVPPIGDKLKAEDATALKDKLTELQQAVAALPAKLKGKTTLLELLPDVEIFPKAVAWAIEMQHFYAPADTKRANDLLTLGLERATLLAAGKTPWTTQTGLVVRGFRSRLDGSVQPYGLVVPPTYRPDAAHKHRLDVWLHGRNENVMELQFIDQRLRSPGEFTPPNAFVVHPFGRYSNAFKFAGETDVFEAIEHVQKHYPIDDDRVVMRGFSMGGAGCWQFAVHYPDRWCAAAPGAGFSETPEFLRLFQEEKLEPRDFEKTLWRMYDCDGYARNLFNLPTVAYSGGKDKQKQAADLMEAAVRKTGIDLVHLVDPEAKHNYTPKAKEEINRRIDRIAARGRERVPAAVKFTTYTLRYNRSHWVTIDAMTKHWEPASVEAALVKDGAAIAVAAQNVSVVTLSFGPGECPTAFARAPAVILNGKELPADKLPRAKSDRSWRLTIRGADAIALDKLAKRHGLQGPIDDAFMDRFLFVRPTGKALHEKTGAWVKGEMERAIKEWKRHFRGEVQIKDDKDIIDADIASANLVLWGDPASNAMLEKVAKNLPIAWNAKEVKVGDKTHSAETHVPILIYPNPLNPRRYVVLNSGFTYREYDYLNNARQTPKLPDWAVIDVTTPPSTRWPGNVVAADFFGEDWQLRRDK